MSEIPWSAKPKIDALSLTDSLLRLVLNGTPQNQLIPFSDVSSFITSVAQGSSVELIASEANLPPVTNGSHQLEQSKSYLFTETMQINDPILIPAGYIGFLKTSFLQVGSIFYGGAGDFIRTLNLEGSIITIADAGGGKIIIVTASSHGLVDGQYVNITNTTNYNGERFLVSNAASVSFQIQRTFVADETGDFNTGYSALQILDFRAVSTTSAGSFLQITSTGLLNSTFVMQRTAASNFASPGTIDKGVGISIDTCILTWDLSGFSLLDCASTVITKTQFISVSGTINAGLDIAGSNTNNISIDSCQFSLNVASQHAMFINSDIPNTQFISITNSADNNVADDYFNPTGLDERAPQVITKENGFRKNSMTVSESRNNGILVVDSSSGAVTIANAVPIAGDWIEDPSTERFLVDLEIGSVLYTGIKPIVVQIRYSLEVAATANPAQNLILDVRINGIQQTKTIRVGLFGTTFTPVLYNGGNFLINPGDIIQIFLQNTTNPLTETTDVTDATLLITLD